MDWRNRKWMEFIGLFLLLLLFVFYLFFVNLATTTLLYEAEGRLWFLVLYV